MSPPNTRSGARRALAEAVKGELAAEGGSTPLHELARRLQTALALELGFSSHSHFSERFRNEFGVPPSQVRDERRTRALLEAAARG